MAAARAHRRTRKASRLPGVRPQSSGAEGTAAVCGWDTAALASGMALSLFRLRDLGPARRCRRRASLQLIENAAAASAERGGRRAGRHLLGHRRLGIDDRSGLTAEPGK